MTATRPLLIGLDCRTALARKTGDRTYTLNLLHGLARLDLDAQRWRFHLLLDAPDSEGILPPSKYFEPIVLAAPNSRAWTLWALPRYAQRARLDLVHLHYLAPLLPCPFVSTIHDVVWRARPQTFPLLHRAIMNVGMPGTARRARSIITVSEFSRHEIARYLRISKTKIVVTPNAVDPKYMDAVPHAAIEAVRAKYGIGAAPYVLSVGVQQPRKNVARLVDAFARFKAQHPSATHRLVITGKSGWGDNSQPTTHNSQLVHTGYVADDELPALYAGAACFAYPSLYEGFGLPILEAGACGTAVLTSDRGAMREVAGDAAQLVDPYSVTSIADGLAKVLLDETWRKELAQRGKLRAAQFSVERQAQATLDVYRSALKVL